MSLAQFSDVHFGYPGTEILTGASLLIRPGDRMALVAHATACEALPPFCEIVQKLDPPKG